MSTPHVSVPDRPITGKKPGLRQWTVSGSETRLSVDIGPPGIQGLWTFWWVWQLPAGMGFALLFGLGLLLFQSISLFVPAKLWMLLCLVCAESPVLWTLIRGLCWRERLQMSGSRVWIRRGYSWRTEDVSLALIPGREPWIAKQSPVSGWWASPANVIGRTHPEPNAGLFGERLWLAGQDSEISVGTGLDACQLEALRSRVAEALTAVQAPGSEGPWEYQLAGRLNAGALYRRFSEGIRRYYAIFDLSVLALYLVLGPLLSDLRFAEYQWLYPVAVIAHLIMLLQRKGTERYAAGLRYYDQRIGPMWFLLAYPALGFCLGLYAGVLMLHVLEAHWQVGVVVAAALPLLSTLVYVRAQRTAQVMPVGTGAVPGALLSWLWMVPLVAISLFHEQAVASMMAGQGHRALLFAAVSTVPISVLVYLPVRIHYFVEAPADPGNRISFAFTILSLGLGHVLLG